MVSQKAGNDFDLIGIGSVFDSPLQVPKHQREYAWQKNEVTQLLDDLSEAKSAGQEYFLGTIVTVKNLETKRLDVIDGQQRLTTVSLIYKALVNYLRIKSANDKVVRKIEEERLSDFDKDSEQDSPRLVLNIDDDEYFRCLMGFTEAKANASKPSHNHLRKALDLCEKWVRDRIKGMSDGAAIAELKSIDTFLSDQASVLLLKTSDPAQAFKMFETLNDRGLRTSQADLVKSYLFGRSGNRIDEAQAKWSSMKDNLSELDDDNIVVTFLRHVLIVTKSYVKAQDVFDFTQKQTKGQSQAMALLSNLETLSTEYVSTYKPNSGAWNSHTENSKRALAVLNLFDIQPVRPLLLALGMKFSGKTLQSTLEFLVSLTVRNVVAARSRSQQFESTFAACANDVYTGKITTFSEIKNSLKQFVVNDVDFKTFFSKASSSKASLSRYYLRALEAQRNGELAPWFIVNSDAGAVNLEHILPKTLPENGWDKFDHDEHRFYRNKIGNLCLLDVSSNSHTGQEPFKIKKSAYLKSKLSLTHSVGENADWTKEAIEQRQQELAELAVQVWSL